MAKTVSFDVDARQSLEGIPGGSMVLPVILKEDGKATLDEILSAVKVTGVTVTAY